MKNHVFALTKQSKHGVVMNQHQDSLLIHTENVDAQTVPGLAVDVGRLVASEPKDVDLPTQNTISNVQA